ncbi:helix-turn-helix transcriptional regulator [Enterovibrio sp. ZSDZ42]|uniref:Helix-turn-helix transcriptional regulator n=1 Tax=Enterovibrio gelatinilyticus TaxID=2899819 RepID=A0ABT5R362_9GAMM|nr:helix-turn-helix domain-containing protein [Enterovibrio sp. ZSDZ42]MDD1794704.1 helix-turn-helix transcriptional regulator [Enterovibrio sp. ZSDZ42]
MHIPYIHFNLKKTHQAELEIIDLSEVNRRNHTTHSPSQPHRVTFFMLIFIEQGSGYHWVDFKQHSFQAGSVIFVQREQVHAFDFSNNPQGKILMFTQAFLDKVHDNMRLPSYTPTHLNNHYSPLLTLDVNNQSRTRSLLNEMQTELQCHDADPLIVMYLFSALSLLHRRLKRVAEVDNLSPSQSRMLSKFMALLQVNFERVRDANWYASQLATTYKTLNRVTKIATSLTAKQMIDSYTIIEIKRRLVVSKVTTQQIALDFGFEDPSNFVKYFKKETNMTPSLFRNHHSQMS